MRRKFRLLLMIASMLVACAESPQRARTGSCEDVVPGCTAERLPDVTLAGDQTREPLKSVDGFSLAGVIGFDEALRRGAAEGGMYSSETVRVTLGSTDASEQHWGQGKRLFYAIDWAGGICGGIGSGNPRLGPRSPTCVPIIAGTIIDALTGEFIVSGESPATSP